MLKARSICPPRPGLTIQTLLTKHDFFMKTWKASNAYQELSILFTETLLKTETLKIRSRMCLCLGSFSAYTTCSCHKTHNDSLSQLVAFESWVELLKTKHTIENVYLQDPVFNALDIEFLQLRGFTVIETPASDDLISLSTFLFIPYGEIRGQIRGEFSADPVYPPLYIGNDLSEHSEYHVYYSRDEKGEEQIEMGLPASTPKQRAAILPFLQQSVIRAMPESDVAVWLGDLTLYYKPDSKEDLKPVAFELDDCDLFTDEEAEAHWAEYKEKREMEAQEESKVNMGC